jgi:alkylation response protein AidB-like acyl-CoA dehydrogenase
VLTLTLRDSPEEAAMRREVRDWAARALPDDLRWRDDYPSLLRVDRLLSAAGLLGITWPVDVGGRGASPLLDAVLTEELGHVGVRRARTPAHQGVNNLAPALIAHASDAQRQRFLPPILAVDETWCQGFSEPDAGSDLAAVRTVATRQDGQYVVRGTKVWTSHAQHADWMYALVRTGAPSDRHRGLSFLVFPMASPGVTVRPITSTTGRREFNEVVLDDVAVSTDGRIGEEGAGWKVALTVLASERLSGRFRYAMFRREAEELARQLAAAVDDRRGDPAVGALWDHELGRAVAELEGMAALGLRAESMRAAGKDTGMLSSVNKLWWPAVHQRLVELGLRAATSTCGDADAWYDRWLDARAESIYGGTAQVQRDILAERHLGLPRGRRP